MKNITKRKDNRWQGSFVLNKKRYYVYDKNQKKCYTKLINLKKQLIEKVEEQTPQIKRKNNFIVFANMWYEKFKKNKIKNSTKEMYENCLKNHLSKLNYNIEKITTIKLQDFLNSLGNTRTKEIAYICLNQIFKKALELKVIKENPTDFLEKGKVTRNKKLGFTIKEQEKILKNLKNDKFSKLILFYLLTGCRKSEGLSFTKNNIKNEYIYIQGTKTKKAQRYIKISKTYQNILEKLEEEKPFNYESKYLEKKFRKFCEKIQIKGTIHQLRHTFASNLYYLGAKDKERQEYLGHSTIAITNDIYTHLDPTITKQDILNLYKDLYPKF